MSNFLIAQSAPFSNGRIERAFGGGLTIMEMMEQSEINMPLAYRIGRIRVCNPVSGDAVEIPRDNWHAARPKPGMLLTMTLEPGKGRGGGGKSILGLVLSIAVLAAGAWAGFGIAAIPGVVGALGSTGASILGGVVTGVIPTPGKLYIGGSIR